LDYVSGSSYRDYSSKLRARVAEFEKVKAILDQRLTSASQIITAVSIGSLMKDAHSSNFLTVYLQQNAAHDPYSFNKFVELLHSKEPTLTAQMPSAFAATAPIAVAMANSARSTESKSQPSQPNKQSTAATAPANTTGAPRKGKSGRRSRQKEGSSSSPALPTPSVQPAAQPSAAQPAAPASAQSPAPRKLICNFCKTPGHHWRSCNDLAAKLSVNAFDVDDHIQADSPDQLIAAADPKLVAKLLQDSGASFHIVSDLAFFDAPPVPLTTPINLKSLKAGDRGIFRCTHFGVVSGYTDQGEFISIHAYYSPEATRSVLSTNLLDKQGIGNITFNGATRLFRVSPDMSPASLLASINMPIAVSRVDAVNHSYLSLYQSSSPDRNFSAGANAAYAFDSAEPVSTDAFVATAALEASSAKFALPDDTPVVAHAGVADARTDDPFLMWHCRLGHASRDRVAAALKKVGVTVTPPSSDDFCSVCAAVKARDAPHSSLTTRALIAPMRCST